MANKNGNKNGDKVTWSIFYFTITNRYIIFNVNWNQLENDFEFDRLFPCDKPWITHAVIFLSKKRMKNAIRIELLGLHGDLMKPFQKNNKVNKIRKKEIIREGFN